MPPKEQEALHALSASYALAVDRRLTERFLEVFDPQASLFVRSAYPDGDKFQPMHGHEELARVITAIARYPITYHFIGQAAFEIEGSQAEGEVYCTAHHYVVAPEGDYDLVMFLRYIDRYRRQSEGEWRILSREVRVDWTENHPVRPLPDPWKAVP